MRVAVIAPYSQGPARGNLTTVRRLTAALAAEGCHVGVFPTDTLSTPELREQVRSFAPEVVHGFHAQRCGAVACRLAGEHQVPAVITITGSDLFDESLRRRPETGFALEHAAAVVCFDEWVLPEVRRFFPHHSDRLVVIPQGVAPLPDGGESQVDCPPDSFLLLMPAALRPVKNIHFAVEALAPLARQMALRLFVAGGALDEGYAAELHELAQRHNHLVLLGEVPHDAMGAWYRRADLVLNCSLFEGGMPNSILEAMAQGAGVLASDIPGNRAVVREGITGWLYRSKAEFVEKVTRLAGDPAGRERVGLMARQVVLGHYSPKVEAQAYCSLYHRLTGALAP